MAVIDVDRLHVSYHLVAHKAGQNADFLLTLAGYVQARRHNNNQASIPESDFAV